MFFILSQNMAYQKYRKMVKYGYTGRSEKKVIGEN